MISTLGLNIELGVIQSQATATCQPAPGGLAPVLAGSSNVASLKINGQAITVGSAPLTIPLVIGSLKLNGQTVANGVVKQQAVALDTALTKIVFAESQADVRGTTAYPAGNPGRRDPVNRGGADDPVRPGDRAGSGGQCWRKYAARPEPSAWQGIRDHSRWGRVLLW
ncbi:choice-of-anchor P family protein [Amycolatopsis sp. NPDC051071]|uniref:choice-of-anchor P family protein n=1 Tax=Amycolatopsis sp. NPDC051071 TaxID=3154637 RepID=UPI0034435F23